MLPSRAFAEAGCSYVSTDSGSPQSDAAVITGSVRSRLVKDVMSASDRSMGVDAVASQQSELGLVGAESQAR